MEKQIIEVAKALCEKFIKKVETRRAISVETYADCKNLLGLITILEVERRKKGEE